ncbi:MAG: hypothetical protein AAFS10_00550 [Myxococcota bacterium]
MTRMFADLHAHPTLYSFNRIRNSRHEEDPEQYQPWHVSPSDVGDMAAGRRGATYTQTDVGKMTLGRLRLCFASITPIESGFFKPTLNPEEASPFGREALRLATGTTALRMAVALAGGQRWAALRELAGVLRAEGPLRLLLERVFLRYSTERLRFMASPDYDYWQEFLNEYDYMTRRDGKPGRTTVMRPREGGQPESIDVQGTYHMVRTADHLRELIEADDGSIAMVLTIEGGHTFSIGPDHARVPEGVLFARIDQLKALEAPLFFITLAHHFDNGICGHARSTPDVADLVFDQSRRMNEGLEPEHDLGLRVIRKLLGLNADLEDLDERRILLDTKHMSPRTRQQYYREVVEPYNARALAGETVRPPIPVVMSHGAYSGVATLDEMIDHEDHENDTWCIGAYRAWGLNAADEDMRAIHASGGLLGLVFEQRVLGTRPGTPPELLPHVILNHMAALVDVIFLDDRLSPEHKRTVWDCICLGTDYDGLIDPISCYPTAMDLERFEDHLRDWLTRHAHTRMIADIGVETLVDKLCWKNAYDFALRHLPAATGS